MARSRIIGLIALILLPSKIALAQQPPLLGFNIAPASTNYILTSINPTTGVVTTLNTLAQPGGGYNFQPGLVFSGNRAYGYASNGSNNILYEFNAITGALISTQPMSQIGNNSGSAGPCATADQSTTGIGCGSGANAGGVNSSAYGPNASAVGNNSSAIGSSSTASGNNSTALGSNANTANFSNSTAIGYGATNTAANQIMLGSSSTIYNMKGIASAASSAAQTGTTYFTTTDSNGNLAASIYGSQDIATLQTQTTTNAADIATNTANIATNTTNIATNTANIATNTTNINTSGQTTAAALGGGSSYTPSGGVTAPSYNINGTTYNNVGSALSAVSSGYNNLNNNINSLGQATMSGFSNAYGQINNNQKEARQGIAMAAAMSQAPMPSAPGKTSWKLNNAIYKNAAATSLSVAHRLPTTVPVAVTAGVAIGLKNSAIVTGGMQGEF